MYKRGNSWMTDFVYQGKRYTRSWGQVNKTTARENDQRYKTEIRSGKHRFRARLIHFETLAEKYLEYATANKKTSSVRRNQVSLKMLGPHFNGKQLRDIHPFQVEQYKTARKNGGAQPATINRDLDCIKNMFNKAVDWEYLSTNPLCGVKRLQEDNEKMWVLSHEEEKKLLTACDLRPQKMKYLKDLVLFALNSGMREEEIFSLKKHCAHVKANYILVTDTKIHEDRRVPINETLKKILKARLKDGESEYVFSNHKGKKLTVLTNAYWRAVKDAGLYRLEEKGGETKKVRFRFHDLRHTFGSRLGMKGHDIKTIMEIMGHKTVKVAMRYQHPTPDHKLAAVQSLDKEPAKPARIHPVPLRLVKGLGLTFSQRILPSRYGNDACTTGNGNPVAYCIS